MASLEEEILETFNEFITKIKKKFPNTETYINREYPYVRKKLESLIPDATTKSQSVEMPSQVNIAYYIFISRLS